MRVAAVDLGTNSTRLLVTDLEDGRLDNVVRRQKVTRLGEGVDERKRLLPVPITRVRNALVDFRSEIQSSEPSARSSLRRAPSATQRTVRRFSARSSGATASRRGSCRATRKHS
jgi:exopolyphosphatase/pppGpp-phosphohydrolase